MHICLDFQKCYTYINGMQERYDARIVDIIEIDKDIGEYSWQIGRTNAQCNKT
jgi:hypothetical protein